MPYTHLATLKYRDLRRLRHHLSAEWRRRYPTREPPKYGLLNRGIADDETDTLLSHVTSRTARTIFTLCAQLGLRIGEAVSIRTADLDLARRRLWIRSAKGSDPASIYLHNAVYDCIRSYTTAGLAGKIYLFPSRETTNPRAHVSPHWAAKEFREARAKAGLTMTYADSAPCGHQHRSRPLYRLTTHSFRHRFIQRVRQATGDIRLAQKLARHRDIRSTLVYDHVSQDQMDRALNITFNQ